MKIMPGLASIVVVALLFGCTASLTRQQVCEKIQDSDTKNWCLGMVNKDATSCDKISKPANSNRKDRCYSFVAMETQDASICQKISGIDAKQYCFAIAGNDESKCNADLGLGWGYVREQCKSRFASFKSDPLQPSKFEEKVEEKCTQPQGITVDDCYFFAAIDGLVKPQYH